VRILRIVRRRSVAVTDSFTSSGITVVPCTTTRPSRWPHMRSTGICQAPELTDHRFLPFQRIPDPLASTNTQAGVELCAQLAQWYALETFQHCVDICLIRKRGRQYRLPRSSKRRMNRHVRTDHHAPLHPEATLTSLTLGATACFQTMRVLS
jgi:hypothetical protein